MLPKEFLGLQILALRRKIPANSSNDTLTLPAVPNKTYTICGLDISCDAAFNYQAMQGAVVVISGQRDIDESVENWFGDNGLSTNEDNVALSISVITVGNYDINLAYKLV